LSRRYLDFAPLLRKASKKALRKKRTTGEALMTMTRVFAAIAAAAFMLAAGSARAEMKTQWVGYSPGDSKLNGYLAYDDQITGKRPAILVVHDREGMTDHTRRMTENWSKLGYVAFAADIFGLGQGAYPQDEAGSRAQTEIFRKDRTLMASRTRAAFDTLANNSMVDANKIALIGYCFGGATGVEFGSTGAPLAANISIHGSFGGHTPGWAKEVKGMYLILHGAEDVNYSPSKAVMPVIDELRSAKVPFQLEVYSGTGHGFSRPKNKAEERANAQSIDTAARTLKELFGT
jgi:dienelactone hydrolase